MVEEMIDAEGAIEKALETAKKANLPMIFVQVVGATKKDNVWEVVLEVVGTGRRFIAKIDSETGECLSWSLLE